MSGPIVRGTTSKGGVLRTQDFKDGLQLQCTAGPFHFDAFVRPDKDWANFVITTAADSSKPEKAPVSLGMTVTSEFSDMLREFFGLLSSNLEGAKMCRPEALLAQAKRVHDETEKRLRDGLLDSKRNLDAAQAEIELLKAELKAVRHHKRNPRPKAVPA